MLLRVTHDLAVRAPRVQGQGGSRDATTEGVGVPEDRLPERVDVHRRVVQVDVPDLAIEEQLDRDARSASVGLDVVPTDCVVVLEDLGNEGRETLLAARVSQWGPESWHSSKSA